MTYFVDMNNQILSSKNLIYVLHHPASKSLYVGQTSKGMSRPRSHFFKHNLDRTKHQARSKWILSMRARGYEPVISILEELESPDGLDAAEQFHIVNMKALGFNLLNHTEGGGGIRGFRFTEEQKQASAERMHARIAADPNYSEKCSERNLRLYADPEYRAQFTELMKKRAAEDPNYSEKMSAVSKAQWTEETRAKKSVEMLGNKRTSTPHARAAASAANKGKPKSAEARAKMSEAKRLKWQDPVYRARQVAAQKKAHGTPEAKAKAAEWGALSSHDTHKTPEYRQKMSELQKQLETPERSEQRSEITTRLWDDGKYRDKVVGAITVGQQRRRERERKENALKEFDRQYDAWSTVIRDYVVHKPQEQSTC